jgi:hypothetical protein
MLATSVGGVGTGERGDRIILDDPHNVVKAEGELERAKTVRFAPHRCGKRAHRPAGARRTMSTEHSHAEACAPSREPGICPDSGSGAEPRGGRRPGPLAPLRNDQENARPRAACAKSLVKKAWTCCRRPDGAAQIIPSACR